MPPTVKKLMEKVDVGDATPQEQLFVLEWIDANLALMGKRVKEERDLLRARLAAHSV